MNLFLLLSLVLSVNCIEVSHRDCLADGYVKLSNLKVEPHPIVYPGIVQLSVDVDVLKEMPMDSLKAKIVAEKLSPRKMKLPCISGLGSCTYNYCDLWKDVYEALPEPKTAECSAEVGRHSYKNINVPLTYSGVAHLFQSMIKGDYMNTVTLYNGKTNQVYGCTQVNFTVTLSRYISHILDNGGKLPLQIN